MVINQWFLLFFVCCPRLIFCAYFNIKPKLLVSFVTLISHNIFAFTIIFFCFIATEGTQLSVRKNKLAYQSNQVHSLCLIWGLVNLLSLNWWYHIIIQVIAEISSKFAKNCNEFSAANNCLCNFQQTIFAEFTPLQNIAFFQTVYYEPHNNINWLNVFPKLLPYLVFW